MKQIKKILASGVILTSSVLFGFAFAQQPYPETTIKYEVVDVTEGVAEVAVEPKPVAVFNQFKDTYVFGSVGTTTQGKKTTVTTIGLGKDIFKFYDNHVTLGAEIALTKFSGKKLNTLNNDGFKEDVIDKKNLLEVGAKLSYQFNEVDPLNFRVFGKAGLATSTLKNTNHISPYFGIGTEVAVTGSDLVFVAEAKQYTNLRKAQVYHAKDSGQYTRKDNTVISVGLQYRF